MEPLEFDENKIIDFLCIWVSSYTKDTIVRDSLIIEYCERYDNVHITYKESHDNITYDRRYHMMERDDEDGFILHIDYMSWTQIDMYISQLEISMFWNLNIKED